MTSITPASAESGIQDRWQSMRLASLPQHIMIHDQWLSMGKIVWQLLRATHRVIEGPCIATQSVIRGPEAPPMHLDIVCSIGATIWLPHCQSEWQGRGQPRTFHKRKYIVLRAASWSGSLAHEACMDVAVQVVVDMSRVNKTYSHMD